MSAIKNIDAILRWEGRTIRLSYTPCKWSVIDHLEIRVDDRQPIPITETGYKSHFFGPCDPDLTAEQITTLVQDWIAREAQSENWQRLEKERKQLLLF